MPLNHRVCLVSEKARECHTDEGYYFLYLRLVAGQVVGRYVEIRSTHLDDEKLEELARKILNINSIDAILARVVAFIHKYFQWEDPNNIDIYLVAKIKKLEIIDEIEMYLY